jgi:sporadic carbohydrate cluster protein (TIGR04323 family)
MKSLEMKKREGYRGYITHKPFGGSLIPATGQNAIMQRYAARDGLMFMLSVQELNFPNCYVTLNDLLTELPDLEGVVMTSAFMLPPDFDLRSVVFKKFVEQDCELHFALENIVIRNTNDIDLVEEILAVAATIANCPQQIPAEFIGSSPGFNSFTDEEN